jgi:hypothetical protein
MKAALEILGYNDVHHMMCVFKNPPEAEMWAEAANARFNGRGTPYGREEWDQLLGHCQVCRPFIRTRERTHVLKAVTDAPGALFAADLIAAYPEAKVILTNRDPAKWWVSFSQTLGTQIGSHVFRLAGFLDPQGLGRIVALIPVLSNVLLGPTPTEESVKARFVAHYQNIREIVPKERLLEYEVSQGWGPLCAFLGDKVPAVDFPRTNDTKMVRESFKATMKEIFWRFVMRMVLPGVLLTGVGWAVYARM